MAKNTKSHFLLSYHDVRATNYQQVEADLRQLAAWGFPRWTLLVIPDAPEALRMGFRAQLEAWRIQGHELAVHGFRHRAEDSVRRSWMGRLILKMTGQEAEFAGLGEQDCRALLEDSLRAWERLGVGAAQGFVPPTWHAPEPLGEQALAMGWSWFESRWGIWWKDGVGLGCQMSLPISFAGLPKFLRLVALGLGYRIVPLLPGIPRLVLHPGDLGGDREAGIRALLLHWAQKRDAILYSELR